MFKFLILFILALLLLLYTFKRRKDFVSNLHYKHLRVPEEPKKSSQVLPPNPGKFYLNISIPSADKKIGKK